MGSASQPMLVVKYNRALLKKRNIRELKDLVLETSGKTELEFKKITPEEMKLVKNIIRKQHRENVKREIKLYITSALLTALIGYLLYSFFIT